MKKVVWAYVIARVVIETIQKLKRTPMETIDYVIRELYLKPIREQLAMPPDLFSFDQSAYNDKGGDDEQANKT